jgi:hypothetical protein
MHAAAKSAATKPPRWILRDLFTAFPFFVWRSSDGEVRDVKTD